MQLGQKTAIATSIAQHARSMNDARTIDANASSSGANAKRSTESIRRLTPPGKHRTKREGEEAKIELNLNSNRIAPKCEDEQRHEQRNSQQVHPNKDTEPIEHLHTKFMFIASSKPPKQ